MDIRFVCFCKSDVFLCRLTTVIIALAVVVVANNSSDSPTTSNIATNSSTSLRRNARQMYDNQLEYKDFDAEQPVDRNRNKYDVYGRDGYRGTSFVNGVHVSGEQRNGTDNRKPAFRDCKNYAPSVKEEQAANVFVMKVEADDPDVGDKIEYSFVMSASERPRFRIDAKTGEIYTSHTFDRDEPIREKEVRRQFLSQINCLLCLQTNEKRNLMLCFKKTFI